MFEKADPSAFAKAHHDASSEVDDVDLHVCADDVVGDVAQAQPLRSIEWSELAAKFTAARDLRVLLRKDTNAKLGIDSGAGVADGDVDFATAAASFFRANEEDERAVNQKGLEHRKTSSGMYPDVTGDPSEKFPEQSRSLQAHANRAKRETSND